MNLTAMTVFKTWWWTIAFCAAVGGIYCQGIKTRGVVLSDLTHRLAAIEQEIRLTREEQENLTLRLASQSDPAWIELVLLRQMGVVPDGFLKVHFTQ